MLQLFYSVGFHLESLIIFTNNGTRETVSTEVTTEPFALTLPRGKLLRKAGVRFVCPKVKAGGLLATLRRAPLYWAAIWALKARQFSGYVYRVWKEKTII